MFRSALLALKPSATQRYVIDSAVALAKPNQLELTACTVVDPNREAPAEAVPLGAAAFKRHHDEQLLVEARRSADESIAAFRGACQQQSVACQTVVSEGPTVGMINQYVVEHDVLLVGHSVGDDTGSESILYQILKHSARPAIVFPKQSARDGDVVVAYDGSHQAARTLASFAYSGIAQGRTVHVVAFNDNPQAASSCAAQAARFLRHHGIEAQLHGETATSSIPEMLLEKATQYSAGMLVMGAFGKSAVREFLFGSVTRQVLHTMAIPVFLSH